MTDISGFGVEVTLIASVTFPSGITITQFADDADPVDSPSQEIAEAVLTLNGDLVSWGRANPVPLTLNVIPQSDDDVNLQILAEANRVGRGKTRARDIITATVSYPNGNTSTLSGGVITAAMMNDSIASVGRLKSKAYVFSFENRVETRSVA